MLHGTTENPLDKNRHSPNPVVPTPTGTSATKQSTTGNSAIQCKLQVPAVCASSGEGSTPLYSLLGDVPLDSVWFSPSLSLTGYMILRKSVLNRVYNFAQVCPRQCA